MKYFLLFKVKEEVTQQESAAAPAVEAPVEPATSAENNAAPAAPQAPAAKRPDSAFPGGRRVSVVEETCCGGFQKSKICTVQ